MRIRLVSLMAENSSFLYRALAGWVARQVGVPIDVIDEVHWTERERMLDRGEVQLGFICGLPYVRKVDRPASPSPIPPVVVSRQVPRPLRQALRQTLLRMHAEEEGRSILDTAMIARFAQMKDAVYDEIRRMAREAESVCLMPTRAAA